MSHSVCPHCARPLSGVGELSDDHVLPSSFGGVDKIRTCKRCNDVLGGGVEARLLGPRSVFTLLSQSQGWTEGTLQARVSGGRARSHLGYGRHEPSAPRVRVTDTSESEATLEVILPPHIGVGDLDDPYIKSLVRKHGGSHARAEITSSGTAPAELFEMDMSMRIEDIRRLVAKVALCSGTQRWGDEFAKSALADKLRVVLNVWSDWPAHDRPPPLDDPQASGAWPLEPEEVAHLGGQIEKLLPPVLSRVAAGVPVVGHVDLPPSLTIFTPAGGGSQTLVVVVALGVVLPALGFDAPLPPSHPLRAELMFHRHRARG